MDIVSLFTTQVPSYFIVGPLAVALLILIGLIAKRDTTAQAGATVSSSTPVQASLVTSSPATTPATPASPTIPSTQPVSPTFAPPADAPSTPPPSPSSFQAPQQETPAPVAPKAEEKKEVPPSVPQKEVPPTPSQTVNPQVEVSHSEPIPQVSHEESAIATPVTTEVQVESAPTALAKEEVAQPVTPQVDQVPAEVVTPPVASWKPTPQPMPVADALDMQQTEPSPSVPEEEKAIRA